MEDSYDETRTEVLSSHHPIIAFLSSQLWEIHSSQAIRHKLSHPSSRSNVPEMLVT